MGKEKIPSRVNRRGGKRGCLCDDGTYSVECCDGSLHAQGIGSVTRVATNEVTAGKYSYKAESCTGGYRITLTAADELTVGNIYHLTISQALTGCYRITEINYTEGNEVSTFVAYDNCTTCNNEN
jgi:hypothetical protein